MTSPTGNYVLTSRPELGNYVIADRRGQDSWPSSGTHRVSRHGPAPSGMNSYEVTSALVCLMLLWGGVAVIGR
jgi:hypothetical protein